MKKVFLKDICEDIQYGYTASAEDEEVGPKFLRITDIVPDIIDWQSVPYCRIEEKKFDKYALHNGDIVIARTGATTGYAKYLKDPPQAVFASYLIRIKIKDGIDKRFISHIVQSQTYKDFIKTIWGGAAQPNANAKVLTSFPILLPDITIQNKISSILSPYDDLIENNIRRIQILEEMAQLIYREWFINFRFPGHEKAKFANSELGKIPEGWKVKRLGDVSLIIMGQSPKSIFYNDKGEGLPFHQGVTNFNKIFPKTRMYCTALNRIAEEGDILFSVRAPVGRINISNTRMVIGRGLCAIRSKTNGQWFVFMQLKERFKEEDSMGGGTIFKAVTKNDMHEIKVTAPPLRLILSFEEIVNPVLGEIKNLTVKNRKLRTTRDILLPKLISGELDVENLDVEIRQDGGKG